MVLGSSVPSQASRRLLACASFSQPMGSAQCYRFVMAALWMKSASFRFVAAKWLVGFGGV